MILTLNIKEDYLVVVDPAVTDWVIISFFFTITISIALVSVHYRNKYEELRRYIKIIEMED